MRRLLPLAVILSASCARPSGRATPSSPITAAELKHRVEILADDSMGGRLPGSRGNIEATDYVAAEFKRMGLQPAGDSGGYLQYVPMISSRLDTTEHLTVNGAPLAFGTGVIAQNPTNLPLTLVATGAPVVYGGRLGPDATAMISPDSGGGQIIVFALGLLPDGHTDARSVRYIPAFHKPMLGIVTVVPTKLPPVSIYAILSTQVPLHGWPSHN